MQCWILLGMMGAGKTSVGRALAEATGMEFQDTDAMLQYRLGRPIPQIFQLYGEDAFRDHESSVLRSLEPGNYVLATGGGIVCRPENWTELKRLGKTIYLQGSRSTLLARLDTSKKKRPLLAAEDWEDRFDAIFSARSDLYRQADLTVCVDDLTVEEVVARIVAALGEK